MKQIIDGKRYDTTTAEKIGHDGYGGSYTDFQWWAETLYRTKSGNFFLHGEGGAMSAYSRSLGNNSWGGGSALIPMTPSEARKWCEQHDQDAMESHFQDSIQDA